jgi:hypothetical protein
MKKALLAVALLTISGAASATDVPHTMVGGVIVQNTNGSNKHVTSIPYNVPFSSLDLCAAAIEAVKDSGFTPHTDVTGGWNTASLRAITLQCVAKQ